MFLRYALFFLTNILVVVTISIIMSVFGLNRYVTQSGLDYQALLVFCLCWGMFGSIISLMLSRVSAKMMMGVKTIDPNNPGQFSGLVAMVSDIARRASLPMPEVGVFESPELNAFATGPSKKRSLVAVSTGLLNGMSRDELEGVLAHEIAHIKNGDMVTMTLLQGVVNAFVMFLSRVIAFALAQNAKEENRYLIRSLVTVLLEVVIGILGMLVVRWFSRWREFRADAGSASLVGRGDMVAALRRLQANYGHFDPRRRVEALAPYKISGTTVKKASLFATHPSLEERIARLEQYA